MSRGSNQIIIKYNIYNRKHGGWLWYDHEREWETKSFSFNVWNICGRCPPPFEDPPPFLTHLDKCHDNCYYTGIHASFWRLDNNLVYNTYPWILTTSSPQYFTFASWNQTKEMQLKHKVAQYCLIKTSNK